MTLKTLEHHGSSMINQEVERGLNRNPQSFQIVIYKSLFGRCLVREDLSLFMAGNIITRHSGIVNNFRVIQVKMRQHKFNIKHVTLVAVSLSRSNFATQSQCATLAVQPLHVMVRHCVGCVAELHVIVARQSCFVSARLKNSHAAMRRELPNQRDTINRVAGEKPTDKSPPVKSQVTLVQVLYQGLSTGMLMFGELFTQNPSTDSLC